MTDLSVLICSTHTRYNTFGRTIQDQIWGQYAQLDPVLQDRVEILMLTDNKAMMLGQKRNAMVDIAQGKYVVFVDDDDRLEPDYLVSLVDAARYDADVITFKVSVSLNGEAPKICEYHKDYARDRNTPTGYERLPNHICAVKRDIAVKVSFPNVAYGEDAAYSKLLRPLLKTEHHIPRVLYHYDYSAETTETQQERPSTIRRRKGEPIVDVIILSNAVTIDHAMMTQKTIDSCVAGANSLPIKVIVLEQNPDVIYRNAHTIRMDAPFNYNAYANYGAAKGRAEWIMVANNDLVFHNGWLHALLAAKHPVVSPKCPRDSRQKRVIVPSLGYRNAVNFSGWCFMLKRQIWERIGQFDDRVTFWCSDDAVIEQLKEIDIAPMLVPTSCVEHVQSETLNSLSEEQRDELTWGNVEVFNELYGHAKFTNDPRYQRYLRKKARA